MQRTTFPFNWSSILFFVAAVVLLGGVYLYLRVDRQNRALEETWKEALGGRTFLEAYPASEDSELLVELRNKAAEIGIDFSAPARPQQVEVEEEAREAYRAIHEPGGDHLNALKASLDGELPEAPAEVRAFLEEIASELEEIHALLRKPAPLVFERDLNDGYGAILPNYLAYLWLHKVLILAAAEGLRRGREDRALAGLEASWRLQEALTSSPALIPIMMRAAFLRGEQPVLRAACRAPEVWGRRLRELEMREETFLSLQFEAWLPYHSSTLSDPLGEGEETSFLVRVGLRDLARRLQGSLEELRRRDIATFDAEAFIEEEEAELPRWQLIARMLYPNYFEAYNKAARVELSAELTALVLEERRRRREDATSPAPSGRRPSRVEGLDWVYETSPEGLTLRLDGDLAHPGPNPLPAAYTLPPENQDPCLAQP